MLSPATPAHVTSPSIESPAVSMTASIASVLPSGVDRSATTSQSRRSIPITRLPSESEPRRGRSPPYPRRIPLRRWCDSVRSLVDRAHGTRDAPRDPMCAICQLVGSLRLVPQPILTPLTETAIFLVVTVDPGAETVVRDLLADLGGLQRTVGFRVPGGGLTAVAGIGSAAWDRLYSGPRPAELHPFKELNGTKHRAVSTPGDLLFHVRAHQMDLCFELAGLVMDRLTGSVEIVDEVHGFKYFEVRDLLGFVDGTENPEGEDAAVAVTVGSEDPDFEGSSYVVVAEVSPRSRSPGTR